MQENIPAVIAKDMYPYKGEGLSDETKSDKHFIIITSGILYIRTCMSIHHNNMRENGYVEIGMRRKQIADCEFQRPKKSSSYLTLPAYTLIRVLVFDIEFKYFFSFSFLSNRHCSAT